MSDLVQPVMTIDRQRGLVKFVMRGLLNIAAIEAALSQFKPAEDTCVFRGFVWDCREADLSGVDLALLLGSFERHPLSAFDREGMRAAVVVKSRIGSGIGRLWISAGETVDQVQRQAFDDIDAARDWVARSPRRGRAFPVQIDRDRGIIEFKLLGEVTAAEVLRLGRLYRGINIDFLLQGFVWDFRHADLSTYNHEEMKRVFDANPDDVRSGRMRIATVASSSADKQLLFLWERKAEFYDKNQRRTFDDIQSARAWVSNNVIGVKSVEPVRN